MVIFFFVEELKECFWQMTGYVLTGEKLEKVCENEFSLLIPKDLGYKFVTLYSYVAWSRSF